MIGKGPTIEKLKKEVTENVIQKSLQPIETDSNQNENFNNSAAKRREFVNQKSFSGEEVSKSQINTSTAWLNKNDIEQPQTIRESQIFDKKRLIAPTTNPYNGSNNFNAADDIESIQDKEIRDIAYQIKGLENLSSID